MKYSQQDLEILVLAYITKDSKLMDKALAKGINLSHFEYVEEDEKKSYTKALYKIALDYFQESGGSLITSYVIEAYLNKFNTPARIKGKVLILWEEIQAIDIDPNNFHELAKDLKEVSDIYILGRGIHFPIAKEAALKLKELTYIHAEGIPGGELKHGPISLIDENMLVIGLVHYPKTAGAIRSNIEEIKARDGKVITFSTKVCSSEGDDYIIDYDGDELLSPMISIIPHQLLSYFVALELELDVDKPRNLAKSVTVE